MNKQLSARQLACKAIHEDKENIMNPSIMAKYMRQHTNDKLNKVIEKIEKNKEDINIQMQHGFLKVGMNRAIEIIKEEITKKD